MDNPAQTAIRAKCFHPSGTFVEFPREEVEQSIPRRFEKMVRQYPDRIAVKTKRFEFTYDGLNQFANRIARTLLRGRREGQKPIALLLENDASMIAAMLGTLKAGKTYLPLDPSLPSHRTSLIIKDSQPKFIVTNNNSLSSANELFRNVCPVINLDRMNSGLSAENPDLLVPPDALAYILYTSGSTGQPKGVVQTHRNVLHFVLRHTNGIHLSSNDRQTLLHSCNVNGAARDIFSALLNGASLFPFDIRTQGLPHLADWLAAEEITVYCSVATVFRHFVGTLAKDRAFPKLRLIKLGGESVHRSDVELYRKEHFSPDCILCTGLGSTETGTTVTQYFVDKNTPVISNAVPIGYAAEDTEILLLDDKGGKVEIGNIGEIAVKSRYLFPGYWQKPDLTKAAFMPGMNGEERIYLSGDLGRMSLDSCLEHVGRKDFQIKIRGHRIEAPEIEMALCRLDTIKEAVVVANGDEREEEQLVAYLVPAGESLPNSSMLRSILSETLPDFMIPSAFVTLDALPVAPNGKIDRRALPPPGRVRPELATFFTAPRTSVEEILTRIWAQLLGVDPVGIHDNFFDLGGHSLLATQIISRVIDKFQVELPVKALLEAPTVAQMAGVIVQNQGQKAGGEDLARMLAELEALSDDEAQRQLSDKGTTRS